MPERISLKDISKVFGEFLHSRFYNGEEDDTVVFYDLDFLKRRAGELKKLFPASALHTAAVKANPLTASISHFNKFGLGVEVASLGELHLALKCGIDPSVIIFDSPAKTKKEIEFALGAGININADSLAELDRISELRKKIKSLSRVGVRINPQVGQSRIKLTSVAGKYSKFGIPIGEFRKEIAGKFLEYDWLEGVHLHVGSQGCTINMLLQGIGVAYRFTETTNDLLRKNNRPNRIIFFDIGGGMPADYTGSETESDMKKYAAEIKKQFPKLFNGGYRIITEFGRWINAGAGWTASRVEYVKRFKGVNTAMIHIGADMFLRRAYHPDHWHHDIHLLDSNGRIKRGRDANKYVVAGPLCFAGDVLAKEIELPRAEEGDYIVVRDTGAYTLSMWSRYNSRPVPKVVGYSSAAKKKFSVMKKKESIDELYTFWDI